MALPRGHFEQHQEVGLGRLLMYLLYNTFLTLLAHVTFSTFHIAANADCTTCHCFGTAHNNNNLQVLPGTY